MAAFLGGMGGGGEPMAMSGSCVNLKACRGKKKGERSTPLHLDALHSGRIEKGRQSQINKSLKACRQQQASITIQTQRDV